VTIFLYKSSATIFSLFLPEPEDMGSIDNVAPNGVHSASEKDKCDLLALAETVQREAKVITDYYHANNRPPPSLSESLPSESPGDLQAAREKLREAARAVYDIAT
jgi:hypothetical protein